MVKHYIHEKIADIGCSERTTEIPTHDIEWVKKNFKLYGTETYSFKLYDVDAENFYFKGKKLERRSPEYNQEYYKVGEFVPNEEFNENSQTESNGKKIIGWCKTLETPLLPIHNETEKAQIISPKELQFEYMPQDAGEDE